MPSLTNAEGEEFTFTSGTHDKYWQVVIAGSVVATRYHRRNTDKMGAVTVHHFPNPAMARVKYNKLLDEKERKGYVSTSRSHTSFSIPDAILTVASSTNDTGRGGVNPNAGFALIAYHIDAAVANNCRLKSGDPLQRAITTGQMSARRAALASLGGYAIDSPQLPSLDDETLEVMAGLVSSGSEIDLTAI